MAFLTPLPLLSVSPPPRSSVSPHRPPTCATKAPVSPLADHIIIRIDNPDSKTSGGLFLSSDSATSQRTGTVVAVGSGRYSSEGQHEPIDLAPGDRVLWRDEYGAEKVESTPAEGKLISLKIFSIVGKMQ